MAEELTGVREEEIKEADERNALRQKQQQWNREQELLQQRLHDEEWERIRQEQQLVVQKSHAGTSFVSASRSTQRFYDNCREDMREQIYAAHGLSADRVEGMEEFRSGRFRGLAASAMLAALGMTIAAAILYGMTSYVTLSGLAAMGVEGSLLNAERRAVPAWIRGLCRHFIMIPLAGYLAILICSRDQLLAAQVLVIVFGSIGAVLILFGTGTYLLDNPYRRYRRQWKDARRELKEIHRVSDESDRRKRREQEKSRKKAIRMDRREERRRMRAEIAEAQHSAKEKADALAKGAKSAAGSAVTAAGHVLPWRKKETAESQARREQAARRMAAEIYEQLRAETEEAGETIGHQEATAEAASTETTGQAVEPHDKAETPEKPKELTWQEVETRLDELEFDDTISI